MNDNVTTDIRRTPSESESVAGRRAARVEELIAAMTLEEKLAQLYGLWAGASGDGAEVAPHQHDNMEEPPALGDLLPTGLGQLTRPFGTLPVDPALGALSLLRTQTLIAAQNRFGIPALAHDECLAGFAAWGATAYPVPLSWGAAFDPALVREMAAAIGTDMRSVGVHQGLAPVLDVVRDARWGRVEETIGEDPYLVGTTATAYVQGLESAGIVATLKHFAGYSASRAGRNLAPVSMGARERADVILPPFEMAVRESGVRSVMHSYSDTDGIPSAADEELLTTLLRDTWGFEGTVVADYFGVAFLHSLHGVAAGLGDAAATALTAGVDVELPTVSAFGQPLRDTIAAGGLKAEFVDRALRRVLTQKAQLGLLDPDWSPVPAALGDVDAGLLAGGAKGDAADPAGVGAAGAETTASGTTGVGAAGVGAAGVTEAAGAGTAAVAEAAERLRGTVSLDSPANQDIARRLAEQAIILLRNDGTLPLHRPARIALVGPQAEVPTAVLGCYSFPVHIGSQHPGTPAGIALPTLRDSLAAEFPGSELVTEQGAGIDTPETDGFAAAVEAARDADVVIAALGDRAGLFGRGTSGEGCDAESLELPGVQRQLLDALLDSGKPVVVTLLAGRPYALGRAADEAAAIVQSFFPGQEGTPAIAGVLGGRINPSGRLPVSVPRLAGAQPSTYLAAPLGRAGGVSNIDPTPAFGFGHGLTYTSFDWSDLTVGEGETRTNGATGTEAATGTDGALELSFTVRNTGERTGVEVVQLYLHDPVASVVQPVQRLVGYARVELAPGQTARIGVRAPADLASFTGRDRRRIVEPGELELRLGASSSDVRLTARWLLSGPVRRVDHTRELHARITVEG